MNSGISPRRDITWIVGALLLSGVTASGSDATQARLSLSSLTVPAAALPDDCVLTPRPALPPQPVIQGNVTVIRGTGRAQFPDNPWSGTDRQLVAGVYAAIDSTPSRPLPDVPPNMSRGVTAAEARTAHILEAYRATYTAVDGYLVSVSAVTFDDPTLTAAPDSVAAMMNPPRGATARLVRGATVVRVSAPSATACFAAVSAHVESLQ